MVKQTRFERVKEALERGSIKTPRYTPAFLLDEAYLTVIRTFCIRAVHRIWEESHKPTRNRHQVCPLVRDMITQNQYGEWRSDWRMPSEDTIVRRLIESADEKVVGNPTPLIALAASEYMPNPSRFEEPTRTVLVSLVNSMKTK